MFFRLQKALFATQAFQLATILQEQQMTVGFQMRQMRVCDSVVRKKGFR